MSIPTQALKYGWVALASLTIGTGTIFVAPTVLNRITLHDRIEVALAVAERCLATQTGTNVDGTPIYAVAPPVEVRTWTDTNGASVIMTNAIEWRDDLSMKVDLDAKIFQLIPYYADANTVYDGTTNIAMLTVTGLFASLQIGDHTNQFTSIPAIGTNAATFGPWAWRNYITAWQERYKVLNALKMTTKGFVANTNVFAWVDSLPVAGVSLSWTGTRKYGYGMLAGYPGVDGYWDATVDLAETDYSEEADDPENEYKPLVTSYGFVWGQYWWYCVIDTVKSSCSIGPFPTNIPHGVIVEARAVKLSDGGTALTNEFAGNGAVGPENEWVKIIDKNNSYQETFTSIVFGMDSPPPVAANPYAGSGSRPTYKGYQTEVRYRTWTNNGVDNSSGWWTLNGIVVTNPTSLPNCTEFSKSVSLCTNEVGESALATLKSDAETAFASAEIIPGNSSPHAYATIIRSGTAPTNFIFLVTISRSYSIRETVYIGTNVPHDTVEAYLRGQVSDINSWVYDANGDAGATTNTYKKMPDGTEVSPGTSYKFTFGDEDLPVPNWPDSPTTNTTATQGYVTRSRTCYIPWQFNYCTDKYW
jgi:hypothetical protein